MTKETMRRREDSSTRHSYNVDLKNEIEGFTKLHRSSWLGNESGVRKWLGKISENSTDAERRTPLHLAAEGGHTSIVQLLMSNNLKFNGKDLQGKTPVMKAIEGFHKFTARVMMERGADLNSKDHRGNTAMHLALQKAQYDLAGQMLQYFRNCNLQNKEGKAPLHTLAKSYQVKLARKFLDRGARVDILDNKGRTPLMLACKHSCFPMVSLLLKHGSNPQAKDINGWTPLDYADIVANVRIKNMLVKYINGDTGSISEEETTESSSTDEEAGKDHSLLKHSSKRIIPIKMKSKSMYMKHIKMSGEQMREDRMREGVRRSNGNLLPMPELVAALQSQANKLGDIHTWLLHHEQQLNGKAKDCNELKQNAKRLWDERKRLINKLNNRRSAAKQLVVQLENVASINETEAMKEQVNTLKEGLEELQKQHDKETTETERMKNIFDKGIELNQNSNTVQERKARDLVEENEILRQKLVEIQNEAHTVTDDLVSKCKVAEELEKNLKTILKGVCKLLEQKDEELKRVTKEVNAQQELIKNTKESCSTMKEENFKINKDIESIDSRMKMVTKTLGRIHSEQKTYRSLKKSLVKLGVISEDNLNKASTKSLISEASKDCLKKELELEPEPEIKSLANRKYDSGNLIPSTFNAPSVCKTCLETVRYSWLAGAAEISEIREDDVKLMLNDQNDIKTRNLVTTNNQEAMAEKATNNMHLDEVLPPHLQAKLAVVAAKYSR